MPDTNRNKILDEQRHVSEKVSDLCRYIGFGVVAMNYAIFTSTSKFSIDLLSTDKSSLIISTIFALLVIFSDYLQFIFGYYSVRKALKNNNKYDDKSIIYHGRFVLFYLKQIFAFLSVLIIIITLFSKIIA